MRGGEDALFVTRLGKSGTGFAGYLWPVIALFIIGIVSFVLTIPVVLVCLHCGGLTQHF